MLSAKANAALTRLKEIEEKYRIKRKEQKWNRREDTDSSISSVSMDPSEELPARSKKSPSEVAPRPKLDVRIPDARFEGESRAKLSSREESDGTNPKRHEATGKTDPDVAGRLTPLTGRSPRSAAKRGEESLASDVTTIREENSSIVSVHDESTGASRSSFSRSSKTPRRAPRYSAIGADQFSRRDRRGTTRSCGAKVERARALDKSSEIVSRGKPSPVDGSSIVGEKSGHGSARKPSEPKKEPRRERSTEEEEEEEEEEITKAPEVASLDENSRNSSRSGSAPCDDSVIEESIGATVDGSEIASELSRVEESVAGKTRTGQDGSASDSNNSARPITLGDADVSSGGLGRPVAEDGYANDTFEEISSSTVRSKPVSRSEEMIDEEEEEETVDATVDSSTKKNKIASRQSSAERHSGDGRVIVSPRMMRNADDCQVEPDKEPSSYVGSLERIDARPDNATARAPNSPKSVGSRSQKRRKRYESRTETRAGNVPTGEATASSDESASTGDVTKTDESASRRKSSPEIGMTSVAADRREGDRGERGLASDGARERAMTDVSGLPVARDGDEERLETAGGSSSPEAATEGEGENGEEEEEKKEQEKEEEEEEEEDVLGESSRRGITFSRDAENVANVSRKSRRHANSRETFSGNFSGSRIVSEARRNETTTTTMRSRKTTARRGKNENRRLPESNEISDRRERSAKSKKMGAKVSSAKYSTETHRDRTGSRKEDRASRHDGKQIRRIQKRIVELRLRQEREDLQKYLHELKNLRAGSHSTRGYFSPLEFPRIAEYTQPDASFDTETRPDDRSVVLRERVSAIRRWLKDQYNSYRDHCAMAQAINAHYVPTTVEDAKKTIRELRQTTIKIG